MSGPENSGRIGSRVKNRKHPAMERVMGALAYCPLMNTADVEQPCRNDGSRPKYDMEPLAPTKAANILTVWIA